MVYNIGPVKADEPYYIVRDEDKWRDLRGLILWGAFQYDPYENLADMPIFVNGGVLFNAPFESRAGRRPLLRRRIRQVFRQVHGRHSRLLRGGFRAELQIPDKQVFVCPAQRAVRVEHGRRKIRRRRCARSSIRA